MSTMRIVLPTDREKQAHSLRTRQGLTDAQIANLMGVTRVHANRLRSGFRQKERSIRLACAGGGCGLLGLLLEPTAAA